MDTPKIEGSSFTHYQLAAFLTALPSSRNLPYMALGLAGEAGEVANKVKKIIRDNNGNLTPEVKQALQAELGDVLWYVAGLATILGVDLHDVAAVNIDKLSARKAKGTLKGSGDSR